MGDAVAARVDAALSRAFAVTVSSGGAAPGVFFLTQLQSVRAQHC